MFDVVAVAVVHAVRMADVSTTFRLLSPQRSADRSRDTRPTCDHSRWVVEVLSQDRQLEGIDTAEPSQSILRVVYIAPSYADLKTTRYMWTRPKVRSTGNLR